MWVDRTEECNYVIGVRSLKEHKNKEELRAPTVDVANVPNAKHLAHLPQQT